MEYLYANLTMYVLDLCEEITKLKEIKEALNRERFPVHG